MLIIDFINVGYGDAILIREKDEGGKTFTMLVDSGDVHIPKPPGSCRIEAHQFLEREGIKKINLVVITHLHLDHCGGLEKVLQQAQVEEFWCNYLPEKKHWGLPVQAGESLSAGADSLRTAFDIFSRALGRMEAQGTKIMLVHESVPMQKIGVNGLHCEVFCEQMELHKKQADIWKEALEQGGMDAPLTKLDAFINNTSIRMRLEYEGYSAELPGDTYANCWQRHVIPRCTILKLPHHGHKDSLTENILDMAKPAFAVICVSNDRPDPCPSPDIIKMLRAHRANILFTDAVNKEGIKEKNHHAVRFIIDGGRVIQQSYHCK